jgi:hypothetical protein
MSSGISEPDVGELFGKLLFLVKEETRRVEVEI